MKAKFFMKIILCILVCLLAGMAAGCYSEDNIEPQTKAETRSGVGNSGMSAEDVVREYFRAWNNKDRTAMEKIMTAKYKGVTFDYEGLEYVKLMSIKDENPDENNNIKIFDVVFEIKSKNGLSCGLQDGQYGWSFTVVRADSKSLWLIDNWGEG